MSTQYTVTLVNETTGLSVPIVVDEGELILDAAEDQGVELPYSCRAASCFDCLGILQEGTVEQSDKALDFLKPEELDQGYVLLCAATPTSDCRFLTHQATVIFG